MKVLVIEDHPSIRNNIVKLLTNLWNIAEWAIHWEEWLAKISLYDYDVIILDINMPIMNGKEFIKKMRKNNISTPVLALTSNDMLDDKINMFELWVDDYLTKPFEFEELNVRLKSLTKRKWEIKYDLYKVWDFEINNTTSKIFLKWEEIEFQNKQYNIIRYLLNNKWIPKTKKQIMEYSWWEQEENLNFDTTILETHIYMIRKKLGKKFIKTIKWIWYIIE